ncbi:MAG: hypothetical protein HQK76_12250 [Desulfobacterales bacterium]|nr:hypothetical protein [Desulfobacterales bacterium]
MNEFIKKANNKKWIEDIFRPGTKISVAFNLNSFRPTIRESNIYECDFDSKKMVISQTNPYILPSLRYNEMDVTTLVSLELGRKIRVGLSTKIVDFMKNYRLAGQKTGDALLLDFDLPLRELNIREAFRLEPNFDFKVEGKLIYGGVNFVSGSDFSVNNISILGIGLILPKILKGLSNPLINISTGEKLTIDLKLIENETKDKKELSNTIEVVRADNYFNKKSGFIGSKFIDLNPSTEEILGRFINKAQLDEIRKLKRI